MHTWTLAAIFFVVTNLVESGVVREVLSTEPSITKNGYSRGDDTGCVSAGSVRGQGSYILCLVPYTKHLQGRPYTKNYAVLYFKRSGTRKLLQYLDINWPNERYQSANDVKASIQPMGVRGETLLVNFWKSVNCVYREFQWTVEKGWRGKVKRAYYYPTKFHEKAPQYCNTIS